ncbi:hypothetical protein U1Q18_012228 [Sarracenia purpurea var. burkii]
MVEIDWNQRKSTGIIENRLEIDWNHRKSIEARLRETRLCEARGPRGATENLRGTEMAGDRGATGRA